MHISREEEEQLDEQAAQDKDTQLPLVPPIHGTRERPVHYQYTLLDLSSMQQAFCANTTGQDMSESGAADS